MHNNTSEIKAVKHITTTASLIPSMSVEKIRSKSVSRLVKLSHLNAFTNDEHSLWPYKINPL